MATLSTLESTVNEISPADGIRNVFFVECSGEKRQGVFPAKDLYISNRFIQARKFVESLGANWFVISALHGLLDPNEMVESYDFHVRKLNGVGRHEWIEKVYNSIRKQCREGDRLVFFCGDEYSDAIVSEQLSRHYLIQRPFRNKARDQQLAYLSGLLGESTQASDLNRFYELLQTCRPNVIKGSRFGEQEFLGGIPAKGIYFFFEGSQKRFVAKGQSRVVRVGTHGVSKGSKSSLRDRLCAHFGVRTGGGNHRSSIMRLHIGAAMLARGKLGFDVPTWGGTTAPTGDDFEIENDLERKVSDYIREMEVLCMPICDESSARSDRAYLEKNAIALLAGPGGPLDFSDSRWLGSFSPKEEIRSSGLWNVDYVHDKYDSQFLQVLEQYVLVSIGKSEPPDCSIAPIHWYEQRRRIESKGQMRLF